jgi:hypothetical protein
MAACVRTNVYHIFIKYHILFCQPVFFTAAVKRPKKAFAGYTGAYQLMVTAANR